jgi:3-oxoacyl-[acyl-carrier protein] reductase
MATQGAPRAGRVAIVTGASRRQGIGAAICRALAVDGIDVFFTHWSPFDRAMPWGSDEDGPAALERELAALGVRAASLEIDLGADDGPAALLDAVEDRLSPPSILVNNAAHSTRDGYEALDAATLDAHYRANMRGPFVLSALFARRFRGGRGGRIISMTSGQSKGPMPGELAYIATKGAVEAFTVTLAAEVAPRGITVNAVDPGPTDTGWMSAELKRELLPKAPFGRLGRPEDAARLVAFLASEAAEWITGQVIHSDGGFWD